MDGIINVYKEKEYTSFDVVAILRGITHIKKIGHTGTLDPMAEGVLPVCIGRATRLCDIMPDSDKAYKCKMVFGKKYDTLDIYGKLLDTKDVTLTEEAIRNTIMGFIGSYEQVPPMYSAIKVDGKKLYDLARQGIEVERKARLVHIFNIDILNIDVNKETLSAEFIVNCSKGTYIRSLCDDIGSKLGTYGAMESLVRVRACGFDIDNALKISDIEKKARENDLQSIIMAMDKPFMEYKALYIHKDVRSLADNGNKLETSWVDGFDGADESEMFRLYMDDEFYGLYSYTGNMLKPYRFLKIK